MGNWLKLSPQSKVKIRQSWERAVVKSAIEMTQHLPLIVGGTLYALLDIVRSVAVPQGGKLGWVILEYALMGTEALVLASLVLGSALELVGELAERVSVILDRVGKARRTGTRPPLGD